MTLQVNAIPKSCGFHSVQRILIAFGREKTGNDPHANRLSMTQAWTILVVWLALQIPLGMLAGKAIKYGMLVPAAG
jgi:hypothetical protein